MRSTLAKARKKTQQKKAKAHSFNTYTVTSSRSSQKPASPVRSLSEESASLYSLIRSKTYRYAACLSVSCAPPELFATFSSLKRTAPPSDSARSIVAT